MAFNAALWGQQAEHTINVGQVPSTQTNVPILITKNLASFPSSMLDGGSTSALNGGGDIRVSTDTAGANQLPVEIVSCVTSATPANQELVMWVRVPTVADGQVIYITWNKSGESQPPVTDPFGRNAVWQDYFGVFHCDDTNWTDSSGNGDLSVDGANPPSVVTVNGDSAYRFTASDNTFLTRAVSIPGGSRPLSVQIKAISSQIFGSPTFAGGITGAIGGSDYSVGFQAGNFSRRLDMTSPINQFLNTSTVTPGGITGEDFYINSTWDTSNNILLRGYIGGNLRSNTSSNTNGTAFTEIGLGGRIDASPNYYTIDVAEARFSEFELTADRIDTEYNNQANQSAWATIGTPYNPGAGAGVTASITETFPALLETINVTVTPQISASITETFPALTESINANVAGNITSSITETFPALVEAINASVFGDTPTAIISETFPALQESITANVTVNVSASITESFPALQESINATITSDIEASITESFPALQESIQVLLPLDFAAPSFAVYGDLTFDGQSVDGKIFTSYSVNGNIDTDGQAVFGELDFTFGVRDDN